MDNFNKSNKIKFITQNILFLIMIIIWFIIIKNNIKPTVIYNSKCYFYNELGIFCPGCGGTRAFEMLLYGKLIKSFIYHPVVMYSFLVFVISTISYWIHIITNKKIKYYELTVKELVIIDFIFIFNFIIKNILVFYFQYYIF